MLIQFTTNNSNYGDYGYMVIRSNEATAQILTASTNIIVNVTNTSNCKVKFYANMATNSVLLGNTDQNRTFFTFTRLGDSQ